MRLLVTGASGFLGSRIAEYYKSKYEVITPSHKEMDICNLEETVRFFTECKPAVVIHTAAISDTGKCAENPERSYAINVTGSCNVAAAAKKINAGCILCSSDQVYIDSMVMSPHMETEKVEPHTVYGSQKLQMEQLCLQEYGRAVMLRLSWMYDIHHLDAQHDDFMVSFLQNVQAQKELCYSVNDYRGITDVREVVRNLELLFPVPGGIYNYGAYCEKNFYDTMLDVKEMVKSNGKNLELRIAADLERFKDCPRNLCMNIEKARACGIIFKDMAEGLAEAICEGDA